jgi:hypothetical protein
VIPTLWTKRLSPRIASRQRREGASEGCNHREMVGGSQPGIWCEKSRLHTSPPHTFGGQEYLLSGLNYKYVRKRINRIEQLRRWILMRFDVLPSR